MSFIDNIKRGESSKATSLIEKMLNKKVRAAINEEKQAVVSDVYQLDEEKSHPIPTHNHWETYDHDDPSYDKTKKKRKHYGFRVPQGGKSVHYRMQPVAHNNGDPRGYMVHAGNDELGVVSNPHEGVQSARQHFDRHFKSVKEAIEGSDATGKGTDASHALGKFHSTLGQHGFKYAHSSPSRIGGKRVVQHTYTHPSGHQVTTHTVNSNPRHPQGHTWSVTGPKNAIAMKGTDAGQLSNHLKSRGVNEAIQNPNSSKQGHDPDHEKNPHHATIQKHGYKYSHSTPVIHADGEPRIHHTYKHTSLKDLNVSVYPRKNSSGYLNGHTWEVSKGGQGTHFTGFGDDKLDKHLKGHVARNKKKLAESVEKHDELKDHTKNPYHKTLTSHGWEHKETRHEPNRFARNDPRYDNTVHVYTHPKHGKSHVVVSQEHDPGVGHGGRKSKGHSFIHRHEQDNGIMAPSTGDSKNHLHQSLSYHYGVPKGMDAPKLTASQKRYPHTAPKYKIND